MADLRGVHAPQLAGRGMMSDAIPRRQFLGQALLGGAAISLAPHVRADRQRTPAFSLTVISGQPRVRGLSNLLHWNRPEGASVLAYAYPGLWVGAGLNSAGVALVWTSAGGGSPRVGIPSYVLIAQMLYRDSLKGALEEAQRAKHAGFFTFVLGDGEGNLANVEGSPKDLVIERSRGRMLRVGYGSRKMTNTPEGKTPPQHARCGVIHRLFDKRKTPLDRAAMEAAFAAN